MKLADLAQHSASVEVSVGFEDEVWRWVLVNSYQKREMQLLRSWDEEGAGGGGGGGVCVWI